MANAQLELEHQIDYIESKLGWNEELHQSCDPFIGVNAMAILESIRKSLIELKEIKEKK